MEAGREGEGRKGVRIRLRFEDESILSNLQRQEGLAKCWYWIHSGVVSIAHLASDIAVAFDLLNSCPNGVLLEMGGFALPPSQPASLLQDEDLISVKQKRLLLRSQELINVGLIGEREKFVSGIQHGGVNLLAPEEFEKETGGYQSGDEGGSEPSLNMGIDIQFKDPEARLSKSKEFSSKKRKRALRTTSADAKGVKMDEGHESRKKKSSKKEKQVDDSKRTALQQAGFEDDLVTDLKPETKKRKRKKMVGAEDGCEADSSKLQVDAKKPSRSARRKKAKRMWLREQAKVNPLLSDLFWWLEKEVQEEHVLDNKSLDLMIKTPEVRDEMEAEEERLPVMVAPGHIRFEPCDGGTACTLPLQCPFPVFHFSNDIRNKRQGQGWGQEKQSDKYVDKKKTFVEDPQQGSEPNIHPSKQRSFEGFPLLNGTPQIGDILAYRLVELTHSWTPEISPYRVGKVSGFGGSLGNLMLVPVAEYPLHEYSEDEGEEFAQQEDIYLPPYNPDGSLEVELSALMEVRVLEKGSNVSDVEPQPETLGPTSTVAPATRPEVPFENKFCENEQAPGYKLNGTVQGLSKTHNQQHSPVDVSKPVENFAEKVESVTTSGRGSGKVLMGDEAWQDILCQELDRKKEELNVQLGQDGCVGNDLNCKESSAPTQIDTDNTQKGLTFEGKKIVTTYKKTAFASTGHRVLRAGALGPTMALLRANQIL
ncbi:unnamed protein product [Sphagnum jensenii]|uniref:Coilin n=1 Tax=Sphagnum jensenii TaxID=128206 RepID=A0ABP0VXR4_9BRYO